MPLTEAQRQIMGKGFRQRDVARALSVTDVEVSDVVTYKRSTRRIQEGIAKVVGLSVRKLFGEHAWDKVGDGRKMRKAS